MKATALRKFQRLEALGRWRASREAEIRDVIVSVGEATLVLSDPKSERPLAHWSLPALSRVNPGALPARFSPGAAVSAEHEMLEIDDKLMLDAIDQLQAAISARRPRGHRLRGVTAVLLVAGLIGFGIFTLPGLIRDHAARITPQAERQRIGEAVFAELQTQGATACLNPAGNAALAKLGQRLDLQGYKLSVLKELPQPVVALPGKLLLIDEAALTDEDSPELLAGQLLIGAISTDFADPLHRVLTTSPLRDVAMLLTRGNLPDESLSAYADELQGLPLALPQDGEILHRFAAAGVASTPIGKTLPTARQVPLVEGDPFKTKDHAPLLTDRDWISLQQICD